MFLLITTTTKGIYIRITGKAHCEWSEGSGNTERKHRGEQIYFDQRTYFLGGDTGKVMNVNRQWDRKFHTNVLHDFMID